MRGGITQIESRDWEQRQRANRNWAGKIFLSITLLSWFSE